MALMLDTSGHAQQTAPPGVDPVLFAAKRFPQPVRVADLINRAVLEPLESRPVLGRVKQTVRLGDGKIAIVMIYGGFWGFGSRLIAVPIEAMVLLGNELEVLDIPPEKLHDLPTFDGTGATTLGADEIIKMGLAHPSH